MRLALLFLFLLSAAAVPAEECEETVTIDSVDYPVGPLWCGRRLDSALTTDSPSPVRLPPELSFESSRIYVTVETREAFVAMAAAAAKDSVKLIADSGYRSARYQREIIRRRLAEGEPIAGIFRSVAPPGYSEHQTGRALDLTPSDASFARTPAYRWLKAHAAEFGFYESHPENAPSGRPWESWHWYYRGRR